MDEKILTGIVLDEHVHLSLEEVCEACSCRTAWVVELVEYGIVEPVNPETQQWHFSGTALARAHIARRLQTDLGVNLAGVALALDLLEKIDELSRPQRP